MTSPEQGPAGHPTEDAYVFSRLLRGFDGLMLALSSVGTLWIFVLMVVINIDVIGRTLFNRPLPGVPELVSLSVVGIIFIQLGNTLKEGRMTRADTFLSTLQHRWPKIGFTLAGLFALAAAFLFAVLFWFSYPFLLNSWFEGDFVGVEGYITFPTWPVRLIILMGCACACLQSLRVARRTFQIVAGRRTADSGDFANRSVEE
jgi:TRAP-type mannitol/chloroaromatic compound transport system permease small subunit